jgi:prophage antirepressor-like protein
MEESQLVQAFEFENRTVRVELFDGNPWWVAKDVMSALGYAESSEVHSTTAKVPEEWKGRKPFATPGGVQEIIALSEQGLYFFVARSDKPAAVPFQKWIAGEVVPSIRKTGSYSVAKSPAEMLLASAQLLVDHERRMSALEKEHALVSASHKVLSKQVGELVQRSAAAAEMIRSLPAPTEEVQEATLRARVNQMVQGYIYANTLKGDNAALAWTRLYREFRARYHTDLAKRARNQTKINGRKVSGLDVAEELDCMTALYAVAHKLYGEHKIDTASTMLIPV